MPIVPYYLMQIPYYSELFDAHFCRPHQRHQAGAPYFMGAASALGAMPAVVGGGMGAGGYPYAHVL